MPSALSRRLDRLEAQAAPARPVARYVVDSWRDYHRVEKLFVSPYARLNRPDEDSGEHERHLADGSLPPEERYTYHEAVEAGVVVETEAYRAAVWASERKEARKHYWHLRHMIDPYPHMKAYWEGPNVRGYSYAVEARRAAEGHGGYASGTGPKALKAEAGCDDARYCLAWADAFEAEHADAEALFAAFKGAEREGMRQTRGVDLPTAAKG